MKKEQKTTKTGSLDTQKPTMKTSSLSKSKKSLEQEAKDFQTKRKKSSPGRTAMTPRLYLAGQAMNALLVRHTGSMVDRERIKQESFEWADLFLED